MTNTNSNYLKHYPELQRCIEGGQKQATKNAINIGKKLLIIKSSMKHGDWIPFIKDNFGVSIRYCQNCMRLAKTPILEQYYKYGTEWLLARLREGADLSKLGVEG